MPAKVTAFVVTFFINIAISVIFLLGLLVAMNGFSESDAGWGLGAFVGLSLVTALLTSTAAALIVHFLVKKGLSSLVAPIISISIFSIVGLIAATISSVIGIAIADFVRKNY